MYTVFSGPVVLCIVVCIGKTIDTGSVLVVTITCKELCKSQSYSGEKRFLLNYWLRMFCIDRMDSGGEFLGLKTAVFDHFWAVLGPYKKLTPLHIGLHSLQICTDLGGIKNPWKIGGNPPIDGKEYTLSSLHASFQLTTESYKPYNKINSTISTT